MSGCRALVPIALLAGTVVSGCRILVVLCCSIALLLVVTVASCSRTLVAVCCSITPLLRRVVG